MAGESPWGTKTVCAFICTFQMSVKLPRNQVRVQTFNSLSLMRGNIGCLIWVARKSCPSFISINQYFIMAIYIIISIMFCILITAVSKQMVEDGVEESFDIQVISAVTFLWPLIIFGALCYLVFDLDISEEF